MSAVGLYCVALQLRPRSTALVEKPKRGQIRAE